MPPALDGGTGRSLGRYRVYRRIGAGGFARVYRADDPELDMAVAVKVLRPEIAAEPELVERFRREAMTAARLRHPHVVTVITVGRLEESFDGVPAGTPYMVMDYHPGSLAARIAASPALPEGEVARIGAEVARGLAYAHRHGIVHRDVKPENVLFAADGRAVVTDFGIARAMEGFPAAATSASTTRDRVLGTPSYFSPEQARGLPVDGRSDVYALGVTLFQLATGTLPYVGSDWYAVMRQHVDAPVPSASALVPGLSPAFDAVLQRCLAKSPDERWASADELADALEALASPDGATVSVTPLPAMRPVALPPAPPPRVASAPAPVRPVDRGRRGWMIGALVATAAAGVLAVWRGNEGAARTRERLGGPAAPLPAIDSSAGRSDSLPAAPPPPSRGTLELGAPPEAALTVDGTSVGRGSWVSDSVTPGRHWVRAVLPAVAGCESADSALAVELQPGERKVVRLRPVRCGRLLVDDVSPAPAHFVLRGVRGAFERRGSVPFQAPLVVPEGEYTLTVDVAGCVEFNDRVRVLGNGALQRTARIRLICG
ncbi:MAG TPA: serine/threonine-protein kinase [Gemmatirosa sp.]|nr:serine/threonine-protein kinase [Gemmatirosa sp.]